MAVRHEVENLVRRGNIFYWRPRIPSCFMSCRSGSRLSLSLQLSDHKKAQVIARRLNLRLTELTRERREFMSTREQLQRLVSHIRDQFLCAGFEECIRGLMSSFDIPDTVLNREKAMRQFFEARAAALLTIDERHALVDKSKSEFTRERH